jgi:UDP-N-acetylmuramate--alanine ligase
VININTIQKIYCLGIGGIGMSAIAQYFLQKNIVVYGYDKTKTAITDKLEKLGAIIHTDENAHEFLVDPDWVMYTPAVPTNHIAYAYYTANNIPLYKRSDVLQAITASYTTLAVAGTHGKTTTSSLCTHLVHAAGSLCTAFLGGIANNFNNNYIQGNNNLMVVEADEYDRSFLKLAPNTAIITSMDADHLDIYGTEENMRAAFMDFVLKLNDGGSLIYKYGLPVYHSHKNISTYTYAIDNKEASIYATQVQARNGAFHFIINYQGQQYPATMQTGGRYNIENALAAVLAVHLHTNLPLANLVAGVTSFAGVLRRFQYLIPTGNSIFIDDYAHHPTELFSCIQAAKELFTDKKCTVVFQPHLYTRTRDLHIEFAESLSLADEVILLPIYPARELPIAGVDSELIAKNITKPVKVLSKDEYIDFIKQNKPALLLSTGAGDIDTLNEKIKNLLLQNG